MYGIPHLDDYAINKGVYYYSVEFFFDNFAENK